MNGMDSDESFWRHLCEILLSAKAAVMPRKRKLDGSADRIGIVELPLLTVFPHPREVNETDFRAVYYNF